MLPSPHIAIIPSAGMGNLNTMLRLASLFLSRNCMVTLITAKSFVSAAETNHISFFCKQHPEMKCLEFQTVPFASSDADPFFLQYDSISRSGHFIHPLLSSLSPRPSAIMCDFLVAEGVGSIAVELRIPYYIVISTSARFTCFMVHLPVLTSDHNKFSSNATEVDFPGLNLVPISTIPIPFLSLSHPFARTVVSNVGGLPAAKGLLINTFDWFEPEALLALNNGSVSSNLPPVLAIGPIEPHQLPREQSQFLPWLDNQPLESVVYVSFGSRTALSVEQIIQLRNGLETSGCKFLWMLKTTEVDKDDKEDLNTLLGVSFLERTKDRGIVVKGWVNQQEVLAHPATGGFISHCGWNSVLEAAMQGVPTLGWPQHGDQMMNADVIEKAGLGIYDRTWGGMGHRLVKGEEIAKRIEELVKDPILRCRAKKVGKEAKKATELGGSSEENIMKVIKSLSA